MVKLKIFTFNPFAENTYIVWDDTSNEAVIVDPGCSYEEENHQVKNFISTNNISLKYLINTHCHLDHIFGCRFIKNRYNPIYYIPELDLPLLQNAAKQAEIFGINFDKTPEPDNFITEQIPLSIGLTKINFLFTPGHTPGEYCIYFPSEEICLTGDVLFKGNIGRTDLWGGDYEILIESIKQKIFTLPDDTKIYPGHGDKSSLFIEKKENPYLQHIN